MIFFTPKRVKQVLWIASALLGSPASLMAQDVYTNQVSDEIGIYQDITFYEGGFSGLVSIPGTDGTEFYTHSDRGVNIDAKNSLCAPTYDKIYAFPTYVPKIHRIKIENGEIKIVESITIKRPDGTTATGVINPTGFGSTALEEARRDTISDCNSVASIIVDKDIWGIDPEGIAIGANNDFWLCEEGGSTIWNLDMNGKVINRYSPYATQLGTQPEELPIDTVFKYRKNNRGFEGITITPNGKVYAMIQSPILYPNKTIGEKSLVHRLLEIDPITKQSMMYAYLNPGVDGTTPDQIKAKDWKIGDLTAVNDSTFLVIEQGVAGTNIQHKIYEIKINKATPITSGLYNGKTVEELKDATGLATEGIIPVTKTLFFDLRANNWNHEKAEGLTIINDSTIAVCNDNDFGQLSVNEDGIAVENNVPSQLFVYHLQGANKVAHYVANANIIKSLPTTFEDSEAQLASSIIYPNPANDVVNIKLKDESTAKVNIYNQNGLLVKSVIINSQMAVDINELTSGVYFVNIITIETNETLKLIKK